MPVANIFCCQLCQFHFAKSGKDADFRRSTILCQSFRSSPLAIGEIGLDGLGDSVRAIVWCMPCLAALFDAPPYPSYFLCLLKRKQRHSVRVLQIIGGADPDLKISAIPNEPTRN